MKYPQTRTDMDGAAVLTPTACPSRAHANPLALTPDPHLAPHTEDPSEQVRAWANVFFSAATNRVGMCTRIDKLSLRAAVFHFRYLYRPIVMPSPVLHTIGSGLLLLKKLNCSMASTSGRKRVLSRAIESHPYRA